MTTRANPSRLFSPALSNLLLLFILCSSFLASAQASENTVAYFDKDWKKIEDRSAAAYYRTVQKTSESYVVRDYFISGKPQMVAECSSYLPELIQNGKATYYYENGQVKEECTFVDDKHVGIDKSYYESGQLRAVSRYAAKGETTYMHYFSEAGKELLPNGNGVIENTPYGRNLYLEIKDSIEVSSFSVDPISRDTVYTLAEVMPEYTGGNEAMYKEIQASMKYPKQAVKARISGTVFVGFIVNKEGKAINCRTIKGIHKECDEEAMNAVCNLHHWIPASHHGRKVSVRFVLPVKFRL